MAITPTDEKAILRVARADKLESVGAQIVKHDMATAVNMTRGSELKFKTEEQILEMASMSAEELAGLGWTHEQLAIAVDSRVSTAQVPFYLRVAHDRLLAYMHRAPTNVSPRASVVAIPVSAEFHGDYDDAPEDEPTKGEL